MGVAVEVPKGAETVTEGRIARWLVADGAAVKADQPLLELETDKATMEVPSPAAGVITILVKADQVVQVGAKIADIDPAGKPATAPVPTPTAAPPAAPAPKPSAEVKASPAAAAAIRNKDLDPTKIPGTGPGGRITKDDVLAFQSNLPAQLDGPKADEKSLTRVTAQVVPIPQPREDNPRETRQPMTMIRKRIAERLLESQNSTATLSTFNEADMSAIQDLRAKYNEKFEKKYGVKIGFMSVFVKAAVEALKAFPIVNARIDGTDIVQQHFYDIGVAVSTEKGLMVPVLRDADKKSFADIEKAIADVAKRARDGKVGIQEMQGGTFTITNGGIFGSMLSTPILNPPQTAILGMHSIQKRAVVVNDQIVIRPMMYLALSYDHRLLDGREAVQFLVRIKECLENPERMLFEV
ncbi:MAG: 2-oxoglutarate dehydrogenase complex dihydrolipoyllysine-residue succinyltransferase [Fimbriiglobus sp.]|nr:2-oxoglutarate dehydrogenase complex dihydrolipoyllysine-residue succinyltransferase [Fimbriiglobus sp.]